MIKNNKNKFKYRFWIKDLKKLSETFKRIGGAVAFEAVVVERRKNGMGVEKSSFGIVCAYYSLFFYKTYTFKGSFEKQI